MIKKKIEDLTQKEVLSLAISVERSNCLSLKAFSQFFEGNDELEIAFRFKELASEEHEHEAILTRRYAEMFGDDSPEPVDFEFDDPERRIALNIFKDKKAGYFDKAQKVYELALVGENRAREFYLSAAEKVANKELGLLFKQLASMEDNHGGWLEDKIRKEKA